MSNNWQARPHLATLVLALALGMLSAVVVGVVTAAPSSAVCSEPASSRSMSGSWRNVNAATRSITRVEMRFHCGDVVQCDPNGTCVGGASYFTVRPFGKCHPTDCDWGIRRASAAGNGWQRAVYSHTWATKYVWAKIYQSSGRTYLRVHVFTDFAASDGRQDYAVNEWMRLVTRY